MFKPQKIDWPVDMTGTFATFANQFAKDQQGKALEGDALANYKEAAKQALDEIPPLLKIKTRAVWEIGHRLLALKESGIGTKQFDSFVKDAFDISARTAADWINVAKAWNVPGEIPDLPKVKLYAEAQKALDKAKKDRKPNKRRFKPEATLPALQRIQERLQEMIKRPKNVIPKNPEQRSRVMRLLVEIRQQATTVLGEHSPPLNTKPVSPDDEDEGDDIFDPEDLKDDPDSEPVYDEDEVPF